jgi:hypothetical protein
MDLLLPTAMNDHHQCIVLKGTQQSPCRGVGVVTAFRHQPPEQLPRPLDPAPHLDFPKGRCQHRHYDQQGQSSPPLGRVEPHGAGLYRALREVDSLIHLDLFFVFGQSLPIGEPVLGHVGT